MNAVVRFSPVAIADSGQMELLKWLALVAMLADHLNKVLYGGELLGASELGRLAFPLFGFLLMSGLARLDGLRAARALDRVLVVAIFAQVPWLLLFQVPALNVCWLFLAAGLVAVSWSTLPVLGRVAVLLVAVWVSLVMEYSVFGLLYLLACYLFAKERSVEALIGFLATLALVCVINGNLWALVVAPLVLGVRHLPFGVPRVRYLFHVLYPAHLAVLVAIAREF